jgi:hypothetical protein
MMALSEQAPGEFGGGIIGVGHHGHRFFPGQAGEQIAQFVQQSATGAITPDHALVNAGGHRHGQIPPRRLHQDGDGLEGMAHDKGSLGVTAGLLMEAFDPRHLFPLFGPLEAIDQHDRPSVDPHQPPSEQVLESLLPEPGQLLQVQGGRVEEVEQAVIAGFRQTQAPDQAGDAGQIGAEAEAHQNDDQPEEGGGAGTGRAEGLEGAPKSRPEDPPPSGARKANDWI